MSLLASCWWTAVRTVVLCLIAWPICRWVERLLNQLSPSRRSGVLAALLVPGLFPELLVGYAYRDLALARPEWAELLCAGLLLVRLVPVGTVALLAAPRSRLDAAAIHCRLLLRPRFKGADWLELARCYWHGSIVRAWPALVLMSIVAFQEFEMAALLQTMSWTDWFVTAQRLGLEQGEMLRQAAWPLLWQAPLLIGVLLWLRANSEPAAREETSDSAGRYNLLVGLGLVGVLLTAGFLIPLGLIGWRTMDGLGLLLRQRTQQLGLAWEIATSVAVAVCAGLTAWILTGRMRGIATPALLLGLVGSLLLSLGTVTLFQSSWMRPWYDTPLPWVLALIVWLLPRAAILRVWLHSFGHDEAVHLARLLKEPGQGAAASPHRRSAKALLWRLRDQPHSLAVGLLCYWAYWDLPTAYLLAPTGMASGLVRLYNFMHFGRSAALSAEASVFFGAPLACLVILLVIYRSLR